MVNCDNEGTEKPLQVEINTIASSFGCLSKKVGDLHRYLLLRHSQNPELQKLVKEAASPFHKDLTTASTVIPENTSIRMLAFGLALAHFLYGDNSATILFVVQPGERNVRSTQ
jgi:glutathione synthase